MKKRILLISPFSGDEKAGHPNIDDQFFIQFLEKNRIKSRYITSKHVRDCFAKNQTTQIKFEDNAELNPNSFLSCLKYLLSLNKKIENDIYFCGFSEKLLLAAYLVYFFKESTFTLIATNNFGKRRVKKYGTLLSLFYKICRRKVKLIVTHSTFEKSLVEKKFKLPAIIKRHHLCIPRSSLSPNRNDSVITSLNVGFMGPDKLEKPVGDFLGLILADKKMTHNYFIVNCKTSDIPNEILSRKNVVVINKWLTPKEYDELYSSFSFAFMGHDENFEGKLSGNLCDSFALAVPWISKKIEPYIELSELFEQPICLFYESGNMLSLLDALEENKVVEMKGYLAKKSSEYFNVDAVESSLSLVFAD
ncbi:hypothetical protein [Brumicola blandensis]|uniref:Glycosyltransferase n=1 Tax=Brumicola blandensis TaxID=3075611 RepID=A0AAW8R082_9ALTE|nr:hypothetical protein [Alteromonas sp. W409]MDT0582691.1 hypothetical protein [Alteromonas sp. W409]